jgi:uncharacterized protein
MTLPGDNLGDVLSIINMTSNSVNKWTIRWHSAIATVDQHQWDRLATPLQTPLLEWQWLHQLEASGSIAPRHGWHPCHLTLWDQQRLVAAAPLYIKTHSEGEFVFDHGWAKLSNDFGIPYYPKLVGMSPATPAVGYQFLMDRQVAPNPLTHAMFAAIDDRCKAMALTACQFNFVDPQWHAGLSANGFMAWQHQSFLWTNPGWATFEDYLKVFKSSQRRNIRRERARMQEMGIELRALTGDQIEPGLAALMYRYYLNTNAQFGPWAARYLNADFFAAIFRHYRHRLLLMAAYQGTNGREPMALSLLLVKNRHLIGRYWGTAAPIKDLHFNMCFYAPIQWAIANNIQTVDPGAGSAHKLHRGFGAVANTSLHRFYDPRLNALFGHLIQEINQMEQSNIKALNARLPFAHR